MSAFEHARFEIWNPLQHPYKHTLAEFAYTNPALPGVTNVEAAMNYMLAVLYPQTKPAVNLTADLPTVGNTLNDFRVVLDDGDGKAAGYRWEQREGEGAASWHKIYDMDWGMDSVLTGLLNVTQDLYVWKYGRTDVDSSGAAITGLFAGQRIVGGTQTNQNLTLEANGADSTGYVQTVNHLRPTSSDSLDLGTATELWRNLFVGTSAAVGDLSLSDGLITSSSGTISFFSNDLVTTGDFSATEIFATSAFTVGTLTISDGSIIDTAGEIDFNATDLINVGVVNAASGSTFGTLSLASGAITDSSGAISFGNEDLTTTGSLSAGAITGTRIDIDNVRIDGNSITTQNADGSLNISANGAGVINFLSDIEAINTNILGTLSVDGQFDADNLRIDGNTISSTDANGNIILSPNGAGLITASATLKPTTDDAKDLGAAAERWKKLFLSNAISDGTTEITSATLQSFRDANSGVDVGYSLFWDGSKWAASLPDTEIAHALLTGLTSGDAGHTQFAMLAGRSGGQTIQGGQSASENLILESTSNASKGKVFTKDTLSPFTNASYSGGWSGTDLGDSSHAFKDIYTKGELKGARFENYTYATLPASSAQNVGRMVYTTDQQKVYVDTGAGWKVAGGSKFDSDIAFDGIVETKNVDVSASISDARRAIWQLLDNANDFDRIYCSIKATSASNVLITTSGALPAGSYRLLGLE